MTLHGRDFQAVHHLDQAVLHKAAREVDLVHLAVAAHGQACSQMDSAFTQDTPTPCRPPETL